MEKKAQKPSVALQVTFIISYATFVVVVFPGIANMSKISVMLAMILTAAIIGAFTVLTSNSRCLKTLSLLQSIGILLHAICKDLPEIKPGFEWSQVPREIAKMASNDFLTCFTIIFCVLGLIAFLAIKMMPYITAMVTMASAQDIDGERKPEIGRWKISIKQCLALSATVAGIWSLICLMNGVHVGICVLVAWGAVFLNLLVSDLLLKTPKRLKMLYAFHVALLVLCAVFKLLPKLFFDFEWQAAAKSAQWSNAFMVIVLIFGILSIVAVIVLKALPYITAMVAVLACGADKTAANDSTRDRIEEPEELLDGDEEIMGLGEWMQASSRESNAPMDRTEGEGENMGYDVNDMSEEEIINACKVDDWFRKQPPGTAYRRVLEARRNGTWYNNGATDTGADQTQETETPDDDDWVAEIFADQDEKDLCGFDEEHTHVSMAESEQHQEEKVLGEVAKIASPATEHEADLESKELEKADQTNRIETLEREIEERERRLICGERYSRVKKIERPTLISGATAWVFFLISRIGSMNDALCLISSIILLIVAIFEGMIAITSHCLETICVAAGAPTKPEDLKKLKKEQKKAKKARKALQTR